MTMPGVGRKPIAGMVAALVAVDVLVASALALPGPVPWLVAGVLLTVLGAVVLRWEYERQRIDWLERTEPVKPGSAGPEPTGVALARFFYYAGSATIGILLLRLGGATVSDLFFLLSLGAVVAGLIAMNANPSVLMPRGLIVGVLIFCAGGLITAFYAPSASDNLGVLFRVTYLVAIWFWLGTMILTELRHVRTAMLWWVVSAAIAGAGAIAQTVFGDVIPGGTIHYGRVSGFTDHVNDLGGLAGVTIVPALALLYPKARASLAQRITAGVCLPLIGIGLILSGSISGVMAGLFSGFIWVVATRTLVRGLLVLGLLLAVTSAIAASGISPYFQSPLQRLTMSTAETGSENATFWTRIDSYEAAWIDIRAHPLYGVGLSPGDTPTATGSQVHNNLMKPLFEGGAFAALGMLIVYLLIGVAGWQTVVRARSPEDHLLSLAAFTSYIAYFTWGLSQPALFKRFGWMSGALVLALWAQQIRAVRMLERAEPAGPHAGAKAVLPRLRPQLPAQP